MENVQFAILAGRKNSSFVNSTIKTIRSKYLDGTIQVYWPEEAIKLQFDTDIDIEKIKVFNSSNMNISKIRNSCIEFSKTRARYLAMIEDDIQILSIDVVEKYIELLNTFEIGISFYSFGGDTNRVFDVPNYNVIISKKVDGLETPHICTASKPASHFMMLDLNRILCKFDETLNYFEMRDFLINNKNEGVIPFLGMFFDIPESWKYFNSIKSPRARNLDIERVKIEQDRLSKESRWEWRVESQITALLRFVAQKLGIICRI